MNIFRLLIISTIVLIAGLIFGALVKPGSSAGAAQEGSAAAAQAVLGTGFTYQGYLDDSCTLAYPAGS